VPAAHDGLDLGGSIVLVPQAGKHRNGPEIPSHAGVVALATGVCLEVDSVHCARQLTVNLRHYVDPITVVGVRVGHHVITQLAEHDPKGNRGGRVIAVLIVEIDGIQSWDSSLQSLKILIKAVMSCQSPTLDEPTLNVTRLTVPCFNCAIFPGKSGWV